MFKSRDSKFSEPVNLSSFSLPLNHENPVLRLANEEGVEIIKIVVGGSGGSSNNEELHIVSLSNGTLFYHTSSGKCLKLITSMPNELALRNVEYIDGQGMVVTLVDNQELHLTNTNSSLYTLTV